jgi:hypothetical protein
MKKILFYVFGVMIFMLSTKAYYLNPATGTMQKGGSKTISVFATPGTVTDDIVRVRMSTTNATVTAFTPGPSFTIIAGVCPPDNARFTGTTVCVDLGKTTPITNGELLGTFTVTWANISGTATVTKTTDSSYYNGSVVTNSLGVAGTYTLGTIPATPFTPDLLPEIFLATGGLGMIFIGIYLFQYLKDEGKKFQEEVSY